MIEFRASLAELLKYTSENTNLNIKAATVCIKLEAGKIAEEVFGSNLHTVSVILGILIDKYGCESQPKNRRLCQWLDAAHRYERKDHHIYNFFQKLYVAFREKRPKQRHLSRARRQFGRSDLKQTLRNFCIPKIKEHLAKDLLALSFLERYRVTMKEGIVHFNFVLKIMCCFFETI